MVKTTIVSAFPGCGKTYMATHQEQYTFSVLELETTKYIKNTEWQRLYVENLKKYIGKVDFLLIPQQDVLIDELLYCRIPFVAVVPDNSEKLSCKERHLIKQQWFGRFYLRDNSHIQNKEMWMKKMVDNYDSWTNPSFFLSRNIFNYIPLKADQYLEDVIYDIWNNSN